MQLSRREKIKSNLSCSFHVIVIVIIIALNLSAGVYRARAQAPTTATAATSATADRGAVPAPRTPVFQGAPPETKYGPETSYQPWLGQYNLTRTTDTQSTVQIDVDRTVAGTRLRGTLAYQAYQHPKAALLLVPEWTGLNPAIKNEADWWARKGFRVFAYDIYEGVPVRSRADAARLMKQLDPEQMAQRLKPALTFLGGTPEAPTTAPLPLSPSTFKSGVLAFGIGGACALRLVSQDPRPGALAMFWSEPVKDPAVLAKIKIPVLAIFAGRDAWVRPEKVEAFRNGMTGAIVPPEIVTLMTLPGFLFNTSDPVNRSYAETARQRTLAFFTRELVE